MDDSVREKIILEFIARAALIRTTGSPQAYATDIGETVIRARLRVDPDELDCVVVIPKPETSENAYGKQKRKMEIDVEGHAAFGTGNPSVLGEKILADLIKCFTDPAWDRRRAVPGSSPVSYLPAYAESIAYTGGGYEISEEGSLSIGVKSTFSVVYSTKTGDPRTP